jgi:hypothetical protein
MRSFALAVALVLAVVAGAAAGVAWLTREPAPPAVSPRPPAPDPAELATAAEPPAPVALLPLPEDPGARRVALEVNEARQLFDTLRRGFAAARRAPEAEARLAPVLAAALTADGPRHAVECRRLVCRLAVEGPVDAARDALGASEGVRREVERAAWDPDGAGVAYLELVEARVAALPARPEGEQVLDGVAQELLASEAARECLAGARAARRAEVLLTVDGSGITYRLGAAVEPAVARCLMMQALPDVLATATAPEGVSRAERAVVLTAATP